MTPGLEFTRKIPTLILSESKAERDAKLDELAKLAQERDNEGLLAWLDREFLPCMEFIPKRRKPEFLAGVYRAFEESGGELPK